MKILNLHTCPFGIFSPEKNPNGGLEKVVYDLHELMRFSGADIKTICSVTDYCKNEPGFIPMNPTGTDEWKRSWKDWKLKLLSLVKSENADVIVIHGTNKLLKVFNQWEIPVLFIDHQGAASINLLYHNDFYNTVVPLNRSFGGKIFGVSAVSNTDKEEVIHRQINKEFLFDGFVKFQFTTPELHRPVVPHNNKAITIGKCEAFKQIHRIDALRRKKLIDDYNIVTIKPKDAPDKMQKYWDESIAPKPDILSRVNLNISRSKTMDLLNESMLYASTYSLESAGISTFEAFSLGIPCVIWAKNDIHASTMFAPEARGWGWEFFNSENLKEFIDDLKTDDLKNRIRIQEYTNSVNNMPKVAKEMLDTFSTFKQTSSMTKINTGLEEFF